MMCSIFARALLILLISGWILSSEERCFIISRDASITKRGSRIFVILSSDCDNLCYFLIFNIKNCPANFGNNSAF